MSGQKGQPCPRQCLTPASGETQRPVIEPGEQLPGAFLGWSPGQGPWGCSRPGRGFEGSTSRFPLSYKKRSKRSVRQSEAALEEKESETRSRGGWTGTAPRPPPAQLPAGGTLKARREPQSAPGQGPCGPVCGAESVTPGLSWESRDETGPLRAFSGSSDFSACPQNKCTTDKTLWSGAEDLL